jgi:hypothetical protein
MSLRSTGYDACDSEGPSEGRKPKRDRRAKTESEGNFVTRQLLLLARSVNLSQKLTATVTMQHLRLTYNVRFCFAHLNLSLPRVFAFSDDIETRNQRAHPALTCYDITHQPFPSPVLDKHLS